MRSSMPRPVQSPPKSRNLILYVGLLVAGRVRRRTEREGFEPSYSVTHNTLSKRAPSATRPSLQKGNYLLHRSGGFMQSEDVQNPKTTFGVESEAINLSSITG